MLEIYLEILTNFFGIQFPPLAFVYCEEYHVLKLSSIYSNPCKVATSNVVYKLEDLVNLVNMSIHDLNVF